MPCLIFSYEVKRNLFVCSISVIVDRAYVMCLAESTGSPSSNDTQTFCFSSLEVRVRQKRSSLLTFPPSPRTSPRVVGGFGVAPDAEIVTWVARRQDCCNERGRNQVTLTGVNLEAWHVREDGTGFWYCVLVCKPAGHSGTGLVRGNLVLAWRA